MKTNVYVDGFNLYHDCLKDTPYKWLNLRALVGRILDQKHRIHLIRYFTAMVKTLPMTRRSPNFSRSTYEH